MSSIAKKIIKNKKVQNLSKYLKETYDNGFKRGSTEAVYAFMYQVKTLRDLDGMSDEMYDKIIKQLALEDIL
jgi:hypothetical protein